MAQSLIHSAAIAQADLDSAIRGLGLRRRSDAALQSLRDSYMSGHIATMFASVVIVLACESLLDERASAARA